MSYWYSLSAPAHVEIQVIDTAEFSQLNVDAVTDRLMADELQSDISFLKTGIGVVIHLGQVTRPHPC
jgi:hypothetical protein